MLFSDSSDINYENRFLPRHRHRPMIDIHIYRWMNDCPQFFGIGDQSIWWKYAKNMLNQRSETQTYERKQEREGEGDKRYQQGENETNNIVRYCMLDFRLTFHCF